MSATVCEAKAFYKAVGIVMVQRGIADELMCPQQKPTTVLLDNQSLHARLKHLSPAKAALKSESRMLNWLSHQVKHDIVHPSLVTTVNQLSDPLTKALGPLASLRSLDTLQGQQPAIQKIMEEYAKRPRSRKLRAIPALALATITDGFLRFDFDDKLDRRLQEAYITSLKQSSQYLRHNSDNERNYFAYHFSRNRYHIAPFNKQPIVRFDDEDEEPISYRPKSLWYHHNDKP